MPEVKKTNMTKEQYMSLFEEVVERKLEKQRQTIGVDTRWQSRYFQ